VRKPQSNVGANPYAPSRVGDRPGTVVIRRNAQDLRQIGSDPQCIERIEKDERDLRHLHGRALNAGNGESIGSLRIISAIYALILLELMHRDDGKKLRGDDEAEGKCGKKCAHDSTFTKGNATTRQ
jgi:hypothetical protein